MMAKILETSSPASADCGIRTFSVRYDDPISGVTVNALEVSVVATEDSTQDGERPNLIEITDHVPANRELAEALVLLAAALINIPGQILANPED
jgi:hypothetical protein